MALVQPSYAMQNETNHPAQLFRMALAGLHPTAAMIKGATSPGGGVNPAFGNRLAVTGTAGLTVSVDTGLVYLPGSTAWQGAYAAYNTSSASVTIGAISGTQWRRDYIVAKQDDTAFGDGDDNWVLQDVVGTNSSSAPGALPSLPNNSVPLAIINCTPGMTVTNGGGTVQDARVYIPLPGIIPTTSSAKPSLSCPEGTMWYETDTHKLGVIVNSVYTYIGLNAITTPAGSPSMSSGWTLSSYTAWKSGGVTQWTLAVTRTGGTLTADSGGNITDVNVATLPFAPNGQQELTFINSTTGYFGMGKVDTGGLVHFQAFGPGKTIVNTNVCTASGTTVTG